MRRKSHDQLGIPRLQQVDLVQVKVVGRGGVFGNAVQKGEVFFTMLEKTHDVIDVIKGCTTTRCNHGLIDKRDSFKKGPVCEGATSDLDHVIVMPFDEVDGRLIKRCTDREEAEVASFISQRHEFVRCQPRFLKAFHIRDVGGTSVVRVDERVKVPVLQLECNRVREFSCDFAELAEDAQPMIKAAHVVVG